MGRGRRGRSETRGLVKVATKLDDREGEGLSLGHDGLGAALVDAVRFALCWQQLLGVHQGNACYQPQGLQVAQLQRGRAAIRYEEDRAGSCPHP